MRFFNLVFLIFILFTSYSQAEIARGTNNDSNQETSTNTPIAPGYESRCSTQEKEQRIELYNTCQENFSSMNLPTMPSPSDLRQKFSCPSIERNYVGKAALGCLKYAISLPVDIVKGIGAVLGFGKYDNAVNEACGPRPQRRMNRPTNASMPDGQRRYESMPSEQRYTQQINTWQICYGRTVKAYDEREAAESANYTAVMRQTLEHCGAQNPRLRGYLNVRRLSQLRKGSRDDLMLRSCRLDAMATLNLSCSKCEREFSPDANSPKDSSAFNDMLRSLRQYNPSAFQCYSPQKMGELACAAISMAAGGAGALAAGAKITRALGRAASQRAANRASAIAARQSADDAATVAANSADGPVANASTALQTGGDTLENRTRLANAVLEEEGLPPLTAAQAEDVFAAHQLPDDQIAAKARLMSELTPQQRAALIRGREDLNGRGVAGGFDAAEQSTDDMVREAVGVANPNANISNDIGLANVQTAVNRAGDYGRSNPSPHTGAYWQRNPDVRSEVAGNMRRHLDSGGVVSNSQQRDEMLRVLALETRDRAPSGRVPDYENLAKYYERAGRPIDGSFVNYLTQGITAGRPQSRFIMESQIAESQMAIHRLTQQMRYYADENRARGLDLTPAQGRARATEIKSQIDAIERNMQIRQRLIDSGQILENVY